MMRIFLLVLIAAVGFWGVWPAYSGLRIHGALTAGDAAGLASKVDFDRVRDSLRPIATREAEKRLDEAMTRIGPGGAALGADIKAQVLPTVVSNSLATLVTPENIIRIYREGGAAKDAIARIVGEQIGKSGGGLGGLLGGGQGAGAATGARGGVGDLVRGLGGLAGGTGRSPVRDVTGEPDKASPAATPPRSPVRDITGEDGKPASGTAAAPATGAASSPVSKPAPKSFGPGNIKSFGFKGPLAFAVGVARDPAAAEADLEAEMGFTGTDWKLVALRPRL